MENNNILFFDGVCGLCNKSVNFLINIDKRGRIKFAPLQGKTAANLIDKKYTQELSTLVFLSNGKSFTKTSAILTALKVIGGFWQLLYTLIIIPPFIRNIVYNIIAKKRYSWFGKYETCRMPSAEERTRFLD